MTLAVRLDPKMEQQLNRLAKATGRTKAFYVRKALEEHLEDLHDTYIALSRLEKPGKRWSMEDVAHAFDLAD